MKTYRNEQFCFEIQIPDEWQIINVNQIGLGQWGDISINFKCDTNEVFNIQTRNSGVQWSLDHVEYQFLQFARSVGYLALDFGRFTVEGCEHVWVRYSRSNGLWTKKYLIILQGIEYALTATCFDPKIYAEREKTWDEIARSFTLPRINRIINLSLIENTLHNYS